MAVMKVLRGEVCREFLLLSADYGFGTIGTIGENGMNSVDWSAMNKGITPVFQTIPVQNEIETRLQGRAVYTDTEVVLLYIAGDQFSVHSQPVDDYIKRRFPDQYQHWKRTEEGRHVTGTPLKMWPLATPSFIREMEAINVFSVDDLANIADVYLNKMPDGRVWRDRAQAWLGNAKDSAVTTRFAAENEQLRDRLGALEKMVVAPQSVTPVAKPIDESGSLDEPPAPDLSTVYKVRPLKSKSTAQSERMKAYWAAKKAAQTA